MADRVDKVMTAARPALTGALLTKLLEDQLQVLLPQWLGTSGSYEVIVFGIVLVLMLKFLPDGLWSFVDKRLPRREQIDEVVVGLKNIARELRIPVVALAQVNRSVEQRADPRPNMSDLKESGKIEEESDVIMTLFREDYYKPETERKGIVEVDILKNRHGPTGCVDTVWRAEFLRFESIAHSWGDA